MLARFALPLALAFSAAAFAEEAPVAAPEPVHQPAVTNVVIETAMGSIVVALETERAPITANNFLRYADERRLDGTSFYRALRFDWGDQPAGLLQGGPQGDPKRVLPPIAHEPTSVTGVLHKRGAISMARFAPGTATADFTLMLSDIAGLDADPSAADPDLQAGYAAFGHVVSGMEVVQAIFDAPIDPEKGEGLLKGQLIAAPVTIISVRREAPQSHP